MTKKHKFRKSKHLLENKKDVDENVENILRMIGEETEQHDNEQDDTVKSFKKSKLSSLVKGFHDDYQFLHKHYKQLISKLENVGHSSSGSDSSDSDTEGDKSDNDTTMPKVALTEENGLKNKLAEDHNMEAEIEKLKQNTEEQAKEISDLKELLAKAIKDKETASIELSSEVANLSSEKENLKSLVEKAEREASESLKGLASMENDIKISSSEKQIIENERDNLKMLVADMEKEREVLSSQLKDTVEKCTLLLAELEKAQLAEKEVQTLLAENQKLKNDKLILLSESENLRARLQTLDDDCLQLKASILDTKAENESLIREKHIAEQKLEELAMEIDGLKVEKEDLVNSLNEELGTAMEEKETLASKHSKCLDELKGAQSSIKELEMELESTKSTLNDSILELQNQKDSGASEIKKLEASLKNLESELEQQLTKISDMQKTNEDLELANSNLLNEIIGVQGEKNEAIASTLNLESKLEQQSEEKNAALAKLQQSENNLKNLQCELEQKHNEISVLKHTNEELQDMNSSLHRQLEESRTVMQKEISTLKREKEEALDNLQQLNASAKTLEERLEQLSEQLLALQIANEDLQKSNSNLKMQLEEAEISHRSEVLALQDEKNKVFSELKQSEASIKNLITELEQGKEQISMLHLANVDLKNNIASLDQQMEEVRSSLQDEIAALHGDKEATLLKLQTSETSVRNFESLLEKQSENISSVQNANDELQKNICTLTGQSEQAKEELLEEIKATKEEKNTVATQLKQSETSIKNLEDEVAQLTEKLSVQLENNSTLEKQLEAAALKVSNLSEKVEKTQAESASHIDEMIKKAKDLENTISVLSSQKTKVEEDLKILAEACTDKMSLMKQFEDTVNQRITGQEERLGFLNRNLRGVLNSCQKLQHAYDEMSTKASQLEVLKENQLEHTAQLDKKNNGILDKNRLLEEEKLNATKENGKLHKHVQDLEVQLQLAKQKLKVTEGESKCKEDRYATAVQTSQAEIQHLEQLVQQFSARVGILEETLVQVKEHAKSGVSSLAKKLDELESFFSQGFTHFVDRSVTCSEELKVLKSKLHDHLDDQKELLKEKDKLANGLRDKEKALSEMVKNAAEAEQRVADLKKKVEEKEDELAVRMQEKREAIKQLSDAIIYHKNNSDDLVRYIRSSHNRPRLPFCM